MNPADRNIVRDRTLILRVLVPGLHTRLNDQINSIQEGEDPSSSSAGGNGGAGSGSRSAGDRLLNLDGVTCVPSNSDKTMWHFRCDGTTYPARLVNLPCPVEVHKTHDHATYHKSADVGQMLIVYEDKYAMEEAENERGYRIEGFPSFHHSGLTPPMKRVVRRRFLSRFEERDTKPVPPPKDEVSEVEREIQVLIQKISGEKAKGPKGKQKKAATPSSSAAKDKIIEEVEEEVVDYEPWMGNGGVFSLDEAKLHPEWWLTKDEIRELENSQRRAMAEEEQKRKEQREKEDAEKREAAKAAEEKAAAAVAKAAAEPPAEEPEGKTKKKKKKDKKKKKKAREEEDAALSGGKKKGIASNRSRTELAQNNGAEVDEVTQAALTISQGTTTETEDLALLEDGMFDFDNDDDLNEDITDLF